MLSTLQEEVPTFLSHRAVVVQTYRVFSGITGEQPAVRSDRNRLAGRVWICDRPWELAPKQRLMHRSVAHWPRATFDPGATARRRHRSPFAAVSALTVEYKRSQRKIRNRR